MGLLSNKLNLANVPITIDIGVSTHITTLRVGKTFKTKLIGNPLQHGNEEFLGLPLVNKST